MKEYEREILRLVREGNINIYASPPRGCGKRQLQLLALKECWKTGRVTAMFTKDFVPFSMEHIL